jgi:uncharacterized protein (TIGR02679 family)
MNTPGESTGNVQRAAAFFKQPVWARLLDAVYSTYMANGSARGQARLYEYTPEEKQAVVRFLNKHVPDRLNKRDVLTMNLADFQKALSASGFACELADLLKALYPERSHITRQMQRQQRVYAQQAFYDALTALADDLPDDARGRHWFVTGQHGRGALFLRYKNGSPETQSQVLQSARLVIDALQQLPEPPNFERLALFAQRVSGDPHCFDTNTLAGRFFLQALTDLSKLNLVESTMEDHMAEPEAVPQGPLLEQEQQRLLLYTEAGLLLDTISSTIAVFHLASAQDSAGISDPMVARAGERILILPLRQILDWHDIHPATDHVYLFENPQVFEVVVDALTSARKRESAKPRGTPPTLVCTSGWPSVAAIQLLNKLIDSYPNVTFHYSGDFDLQGVRIAAHLLARYPHHCRLWRFDPTSYFAALHISAANLDASDISGLRLLPNMFSPLRSAMQEKGKKAYQEGITSLLIEDIQQYWTEHI